MFQRVLVK